jgi:endoglucanase
MNWTGLLRHRRALRVAGIFTLAGAAVVAYTATHGTACAAVAPQTAARFAADTVFYDDPASAVNFWDRANPNDAREPAIAARIAPVPQAVWFTQTDAQAVTERTSRIARAASALDQVPVFVLYNIPKLNCASGGAASTADYEAWADRFTAGLGAARAIVLVEPDGLALQNCLTARQAADRDAAIAYAGAAVHKADPNARVYFDAGDSAWNPAATQAARLLAAHVAQNADGIFSNVSNFQRSTDEVAYDKRILADLGDPANLHVVVDTSRNGNGPGNTWCDPGGRALGRAPTANTGDALVDAYLWVKRPGEADGCAAPGGTFVPGLAYALIANGPGGVGKLPATRAAQSPPPRAVPAPTSSAATATASPRPVACT